MKLRPLGPHPPTEGDVIIQSELFQLDEVGDGAELLKELYDRLEVLDEGGGGGHPPGAHHHPALLQAVQGQHHHQQVACLLH